MPEAFRVVQCGRVPRTIELEKAMYGEHGTWGRECRWRYRDANLEHERAPSLIDGAFKEAEALE